MSLPSLAALPLGAWDGEPDSGGRVAGGCNYETTEGIQCVEWWKDKLYDAMEDRSATHLEGHYNTLILFSTGSAVLEMTAMRELLYERHQLSPEERSLRNVILIDPGMPGPAAEEVLRAWRLEFPDYLRIEYFSGWGNDDATDAYSRATAFLEREDLFGRILAIGALNRGGFYAAHAAGAIQASLDMWRRVRDAEQPGRPPPVVSAYTQDGRVEKKVETLGPFVREIQAVNDALWTAILRDQEAQIERDRRLAEELSRE